MAQAYSPNTSIRPDSLTRLVALATSSRTGTSLLATLIDGHSQLLSLPDDFLLGYYRFWQQNGDLPPAERIDAFITAHAVIFDGRETKGFIGFDSDEAFDSLRAMGPDRNEWLTADREIFRNAMLYWLNGRAVSRRLFLQCVFLAYAQAKGRTVGEDPWLVFPIHIPKEAYLRLLADDFPDLRVLHMVRDPIQTAGSQFKAYGRWLSAPEADLAASCLSHRFWSGSPVIDSLAQTSRALRLEDLQTRPRDTMIAIAAWLAIDWEPCLLSTTLNGKLVWNESQGKFTTGISAEPLRQSHSDLFPDFDRKRLLLLLTRRFRGFRYYQDAGFARRALAPWIAALCLIVPLRMEIRAWKGCTPLAKVRAYLYLRRWVAKFLIAPPATVAPLFPLD